MAQEEHLEKLTEGVDAWNAWRKEDPYNVPDLSSAALSGFDLRNYNFVNGWLPGVDLTNTTLGGAYFGWANLQKADLSGANLVDANFENADLQHALLIESNPDLVRFFGVNLDYADFSKSRLLNTDFSFASLRGACFDGATFVSTIFNQTDLTGATGLDSCYHEGSSSLDTATIAKSAPLSKSFLRGSGVPDAFIDYIPSLVGQSFEFYSCFISYSSKDESFAKRLHADLQDNGVRCWFAPEDVKGGQKLHHQIGEAIRLYDKLLLILSERSMSSNWVETEIRRARKRERKEKRQMFFPVRLCSYEDLQDWELFDADEGRDLAAEVREYFIPDFSTWKDHDNYEAAFGRLLRDLKAVA